MTASASPKRAYSIDAPDQQRLKIARALIEGILKEHDLAGVVVLHTPGMTEFFYDVTPSYSCVWIDAAAAQLRVKSTLADYGGDQAAQAQDRAATANMIHGIARDLHSAAGMFGIIAPAIDQAFRAEHTEPVHVPDPAEGHKQ
jgi:hypothetical protein